MNFAAFKISLDDAISFLQDRELFKGHGPKEIGCHSEEFKKTSRSNKHSELYRVAIKNLDYEVILTDESLFQFSFSKDVLRYAFIQNPNIAVSRQSFLERLYTPSDLLELTDEELGELQDSINEEEYEQYCNEQEFNLEANLIRYDLDLNGYTPLIHSHSHIHIGLNENLRIPCSKILTPHMFSLFVMRHTYYKEWKMAFAKEDFAKRIFETKNKCEALPSLSWVPQETHELYLG